MPTLTKILPTAPNCTGMWVSYEEIHLSTFTTTVIVSLSQLGHVSWVSTFVCQAFNVFTLNSRINRVMRLFIFGKFSHPLFLFATLRLLDFLQFLSPIFQYECFFPFQKSLDFSYFDISKQYQYYLGFGKNYTVISDPTCSIIFWKVFHLMTLIPDPFVYQRDKSR